MDAKLRLGIIKPTLSVSSRSREKGIWQRRRRKRERGSAMGGEIKRRKEERTRAEERREERRRRRQTGAEGNNERALMLAVQRVRIFQTGFLSGAPGGAGRLKPCCLSSLFSFIPCDFRHEYSVVRLRLSYMHVGAMRLYSQIPSRRRCSLPEYHRIEH